ncbi:hypothetical protein AnigIFM56816_010480 [Aspergillus niger]|nr:hypothetical protein AnigIFM56816_010480 [Aspergillus niger]
MCLTTVDSKLSTIARTPIDEAIAPELLTSALLKTPFVNVPGTFNIRDVGAFAPLHVKPKLIFRSGVLDLTNESSRLRIRSELGICKVFDFRRADEVKEPPFQVDGIELFSCPYKDGSEAPSPPVISNFVPTNGKAFSHGYRSMYEDILEGYTTGFRKVFNALRTASPGEAVLFHCTAGKDRTGVMAALILDLMGVSAQLIGEEYALTRVGLEPVREKILPAAIKSFGGTGATGNNGAIEEVGHNAIPLDLASPGLRALLSASAAVMVDFVQHLRDKYGGAEGYLKQQLGFLDHEVREIKNNIKPAS